MSKPYLALGLSGRHLVELTADRALLARWDALPLAFTILGLDRVDGSAPGPVTLSGSAVGATLAGATTRGRFLFTATAQNDHPYNIARRVASLAHLSRGRSGLLVGVRDTYAPRAPQTETGAARAGILAGEVPLTLRTARDLAQAVRALERSWPYESIVGDRDTGILVQSDRIVHVDIDNTYSIAGPLNAPEPPTGASVIALYAAAEADQPPYAGGGAIDLVIGAANPHPTIRLGGALPADASVGAVLTAGPDQPLDVLLDTAERWLGRDFAPVAPGVPLRTALDLPPVVPLAPAARPAFPAPRPNPSL